MQLSEARVGEVLSVLGIGGDRSFRRRLMELGLVRGTRVEVIGVAPLGDPVELLVRGASLSIRRLDCEAVKVCQEAAASDLAPAQSHRPIAPATTRP